MPQAIPLGQPDLIAKEVAAHPVGLIADDQVPFWGSFELLLEILVAGELIHPSNEEATMLKGITRARRLDHVIAEQIEGQPKFLPQFVLPLIRQRAGRDYQAPLQVPPNL